MNIENRYFNVFINTDDHTFYTTETDVKPEGQSALTTLQNIKKVIDDNLQYASKYDGASDPYLKLLKVEWLKLFQTKSIKMHATNAQKLSLAEAQIQQLKQETRTCAEIATAIDKRIKTRLGEPERNFNVVINAGTSTFYITETPQDEGSLAVLNNIKTVVEGKFQYCAKDKNDAYSKLSINDLYKIFLEKSHAIYDGYESQLSQLDEATKKKLSETSRFISRDYEQIKNLVNRVLGEQSKMFSVSELGVEIAMYLDWRELSRYARIDRYRKSCADTAIIRRAREFGYAGKDKAEANAFLKELIGQTIAASRDIIPNRYVSRHQGTCDAIRTLRNLKNCKIEECLAIGNGYPKALDMFINRVLDPLLQNIADPNSRVKGEPILHWAVWCGCVNATEKLITRGAAIGAVNHKNRTALAELSIRPNDGYMRAHGTIAKLLLDYGDDPNTRGKTRPILHWAAWVGDVDLLSKLIEKRARIDAVNYENRTVLEALYRSPAYLPKRYEDVVRLLVVNGAPQVVNRDPQAEECCTIM